MQSKRKIQLKLPTKKWLLNFFVKSENVRNSYTVLFSHINENSEMADQFCSHSYSS